MENEYLELSEQELLLYWNKYMPEIKGLEFSKIEFINLVKNELVGLDESNQLNFNTSGWKIPLKKKMASNICTTAILAVIIAHFAPAVGLLVTLLPGIVSSLFEIENVNLSKKEDTIYAVLPIKKFRNQFKSDKEWYDALPNDIKTQINFLDFQEFLEKLIFAGLAKQNKNDKFLLFQKGNGVFKVSIV